MPPRIGLSSKRIAKELEEVAKELPEGVRAGLKDTDNLFEWYAQIKGPDDSIYEGGVFDIDISIPSDYPFKPPRAQFKTKVYHMNINAQGGICLDILKTQWSPALSVLKVILSILSLLTDPNPSDPLVGNIASEYRLNRNLHDKTAREWTRLYAKPSNASPPVSADLSEFGGKASSGSKEASKEHVKATAEAAGKDSSKSAGQSKPIVIDDDEVQLVTNKPKGVKRTNSEASVDGEVRSRRPRLSGESSRQGSAPAAGTPIIELD